MNVYASTCLVHGAIVIGVHVITCPVLACLRVGRRSRQTRRAMLCAWRHCRDCARQHSCCAWRRHSVCACTCTIRRHASLCVHAAVSVGDPVGLTARCCVHGAIVTSVRASTRAVHGAVTRFVRATCTIRRHADLCVHAAVSVSDPVGLAARCCVHGAIATIECARQHSCCAHVAPLLGSFATHAVSAACSRPEPGPVGHTAYLPTQVYLASAHVQARPCWYM